MRDVDLPFSQICWKNQILSPHLGGNRTISVDGTDYRCFEQKDEPTSWWSFKFNGPAVCYELGIGISTGNIVWTSGPYRAGRFPDLTIFCISGLKEKLLAYGEVAVADKGYQGEPNCIDLPEHGSAIHQFMMKRTRSRHETCNKRLKQFGILSQRFRNDINLHRQVFHAVVVLTQMNIDNGNPLWDSNVVF